MTNPPKENRGLFSMLRPGCAMIMMANMLLYLAIIAFVFNILDPSKINAAYLSQRISSSGQATATQNRKNKSAPGFVLKTTRPTQDTKIPRSSYPTRSLEETKAYGTPSRDLPSDRLFSVSTPKAALTKSSSSSRRAVKIGSHYRSIYQRPTTSFARSPYRNSVDHAINPPVYPLIPVELAPGIDVPRFRAPTVKKGYHQTPFPS